jgi:hypothetical protein
MDDASINYNNTAQIKHYSWNRLLRVSTKLLPFKNSNGIYLPKFIIQNQQVCTHCDPCNSVNQSFVFPNRSNTLAFSMQERYVLCEELVIFKSDLDELVFK